MEIVDGFLSVRFGDAQARSLVIAHYSADFFTGLGPCEGQEPGDTLVPLLCGSRSLIFLDVPKPAEQHDNSCLSCKIPVVARLASIAINTLLASGWFEW